MSFGKSISSSLDVSNKSRISPNGGHLYEGTGDDTGLSTHRKIAILQDSVVGRVNYRGFITRPYASRWRHYLSSSNATLSSNKFRHHKEQPEETEDDAAHSQTGELANPDLRLPASDMLEAIHSYSSHFYANAVDSEQSNDFASMDETALIAMGILLEELASHSLGETGDLVLVESEEEDRYSSESETSAISTGDGIRKRSNSVRSRGTSLISGSEEEMSSSQRNIKRDKKRARIGSLNIETTATDREREGNLKPPSNSSLLLRLVSIFIVHTQRLSSYPSVTIIKVGLTMAPKGKTVSPEVKRQQILDHIRSTRTCHTLKDLEKTLPSIASINGIQVKEYVQALLDDSTIRMEKIGSVNWYWSFLSDMRRERENVKRRLLRDMECLSKVKKELDNEIREKEATAWTDNGGDDPAMIAARAVERETLMSLKTELEAELKQLEAKKDSLENTGAASIRKRTQDIKKWKADTVMWTDNIYILEQYLSKIAGGDRDVIEGVKRQCYGNEYVEGEGLCEIEC
ncbi:Mnd1 family-domain-containing protein [Talaromyces proteolyticus]|uniref:Mnd1 family-domain-containing protein n=1 Tax=Talaromyces proteolyticus TaxID=1131652 RepID=A0AAD4KSU8_9EURO|nr:Mnd1 family-domain-containing protein [Talaromyces proteolyticus]KAH8700287.1 Mnd1 family-domain-containing protein [Talaromyces proteolyticus]